MLDRLITDNRFADGRILRGALATSRQTSKGTMHISPQTDQEADEVDMYLKRHNARLLSRDERKAVAHLFLERPNIFQRFRKFVGLAG
jgi:hypothetical protein